MTYKDRAKLYSDIHSRLKAIGFERETQTSKAYAYNAVLEQAQRVALHAEWTASKLVNLLPEKEFNMPYEPSLLISAVIMANHNTNELQVAFEAICGVRDRLVNDVFSLERDYNEQLAYREMAA